jgi:CubicO group peptidase (beta-lactamase class C family)
VFLIVLTDEMIKFIKDEIPMLYSISAHKNEKSVCEAYFKKYSYPEYAVNIKSVSKIILATAIGAMLQDGLITGVNQTVAELLPEYAGYMSDSLRENLRLRHLLTMSSGLRWQENGECFTQWLQSRDWVLHALQLPSDQQPGSVFNYNTANSHLISAIIKRQSGLDAYHFIKKRIFEPLGIFRAMWQKSPEGNDYGGSELYLPPGDIVKIGRLILKDGKWEGKRLLSEGWTQECLKAHISISNNLVYGYFCFGTRYKVFSKTNDTYGITAWCVPGGGGQYLYMVPELDSTVVITSLTIPDDDRNPLDLPAAKLFPRYILNMLRETL